ncbi:unnamed protein product [Protopolystoma xenopodis]|uniref:Uncharacterized protein n=1 Tax=Protopolystoma xenopodis TaxID=117903 RepID=A0A3S5AS38_9PLAT|nr:unnamed protein product [Protopolystoma xenopodis]
MSDCPVLHSPPKRTRRTRRLLSSPQIDVHQSEATDDPSSNFNNKAIFDQVSYNSQKSGPLVIVITAPEVIGPCVLQDFIALTQLYSTAPKYGGDDYSEAKSYVKDTELEPSGLPICLIFCLSMPSESNFEARLESNTLARLALYRCPPLSSRAFVDSALLQVSNA